MPFDGSGNYTPAVAPNFPAVGGAVISATYYNAVINDIATGLSLCVTRDSQGKPSGPMNWNAQNLTNVGSIAAASMTLGAALPVASGGTALATVPANGQLLIGNATGYTLATITAGAGVSVTNGAGSITIASTVTGMTYPAAGIAVSTGAAWAASVTAPAGAIVGTTDSQTLTNKTLTAPTINGATIATSTFSGTVNSSTINLDNTVGTSGTAAANSVGYLGLPQNAKTASYTLVIGDLAKEIYISGVTAGQTLTIPANGSVAFPIGSFVVITNDSNQNWTIAITTDTLLWSPSSGTGSRTLAARGTATISKKTATRWWITGSGLT